MLFETTAWMCISSISLFPPQQLSWLCYRSSPPFGGGIISQQILRIKDHEFTFLGNKNNLQISESFEKTNDATFHVTCSSSSSHVRDLEEGNFVLLNFCMVLLSCSWTQLGLVVQTLLSPHLYTIYINVCQTPHLLQWHKMWLKNTATNETSFDGSLLQNPSCGCQFECLRDHI